MSPLGGVAIVFVPHGWSAEQAWEAIRRGEMPPDGPGELAIIEHDADGGFLHLHGETGR